MIIVETQIHGLEHEKSISKQKKCEERERTNWGYATNKDIREENFSGLKDWKSPLSSRPVCWWWCWDKEQAATQEKWSD